MPPELTAGGDPMFLHSRSIVGTVRARLGVAVRPLPVATGVAYADVSHQLYDPTSLFSAKDSSIKTGWTISGGAELCT
jgi:opacity protein-like surface antigen